MAKAAAKNTALYVGVGAVVVAVIGGMFYMMMQNQTTTTTTTQPATGTQTGTAVNFIPSRGLQITSGIFEGIGVVSNTALDWLHEFRGNTGGSNTATTNG